MKFIHLTQGRHKLAVNVARIAWVEKLMLRDNYAVTRIYFSARPDDYQEVDQTYETVMALL